MAFMVPADCSSWEPDTTKNDLQNLRSAFDNMAQWGIPMLVDPPDVRQMGSVNERGFLMCGVDASVRRGGWFGCSLRSSPRGRFFAMFIPSLEGTVGPKRKASVSVPDTSHMDAELARLRREVERLEEEKQHIIERVRGAPVFAPSLRWRVLSTVTDSRVAQSCYHRRSKQTSATKASR